MQEILPSQFYYKSGKNSIYFVFLKSVHVDGCKAELCGQKYGNARDMV